MSKNKCIGDNCMGTMITLGIGRMELDWGKNNSYKDHSALFQISDVQLIPYYYVSMDSDDIVTEMKEGYSKKLSSVKSRLDMLGYSIPRTKEMYEELIKDHEDLGYKIKLSYETFFDIIRSLDISVVNTVEAAINYEENGYDLGEYVRKCVLASPQIRDKILVEYDEDEEEVYISPERDLATFLENLDPYITLRILAENPENADYELQWRFSDVVENGWVKKEDIVKELDAKDRVLIVTEGSSDSFVLRKAIEQLYPDIEDFFDFVDMDKNYPFTGTGNLYNFCMGLCRIRTRNNMVVIFDNDTTGLEKYHKSLELEKPNTFIVTKLPDCDDFAYFLTVGPQGESVENINGRAVAIECFLDFNSIPKKPCIRWTSYNTHEEQYQGELIDKEDYVKGFKKCNLTDGTYDVSKLKYLVEYLIRQWVERDG